MIRARHMPQCAKAIFGIQATTCSFSVKQALEQNCCSALELLGVFGFELQFSSDVKNNRRQKRKPDKVYEL